MCGYKPVLLILGLLSLGAWVAWLVVLISIRSETVLETTCTIKIETYPTLWILDRVVPIPQMKIGI